jgi:hypothetical protein
MRQLQGILTVLAVLLASGGAMLFSYTGYSYLFGENKVLIDSLLLGGLGSAFGAAVLSFLR